MLRHNLSVYEKNPSRLKFINEDFLKIEPFQTDALIICPPWGGIQTEDYAGGDLDSLMTPKLSDILLHAKKFAGEILLQMPKQTNIGNLIRIFQQVGMQPIFTVEKIKELEDAVPTILLPEQQKAFDDYVSQIEQAVA